MLHQNPVGNPLTVSQTISVCLKWLRCVIHFTPNSRIAAKAAFVQDTLDLAIAATGVTQVTVDVLFTEFDPGAVRQEFVTGQTR